MDGFMPFVWIQIDTRPKPIFMQNTTHRLTINIIYNIITYASFYETKKR